MRDDDGIGDRHWVEVAEDDTVFPLGGGRFVIPKHTQAGRLLGCEVRFHTGKKIWQKETPAESALDPMKIVQMAIAGDYVLGKDLKPVEQEARTGGQVTDADRYRAFIKSTYPDHR